jgi:hypothetical protein
MPRLAWAILLLVPLGALAQEQDWASLHQFNGYVRVKPKVSVMLHSRFRFNDNLSDFYQFRTGPIVFYEWKPRFQWQAGYYFTEQRSDDSFQTIQRIWAGAQIRVHEGDRVSLDWRTLVERFAYSGPGDFMRYRTRAMAYFRPRMGWQPYASAEALALQGHVIGRYTVGVNYATEAGHIFGLAYEFRQDVGKPGTHVIATLLQFKVLGVRTRQRGDDVDAPE